MLTNILIMQIEKHGRFNYHWSNHQSQLITLAVFIHIHISVPLTSQLCRTVSRPLLVSQTLISFQLHQSMHEVRSCGHGGTNQYTRWQSRAESEVSEVTFHRTLDKCRPTCRWCSREQDVIYSHGNYKSDRKSVV